LQPPFSLKFTHHGSVRVTVTWQPLSRSKKKISPYSSPLTSSNFEDSTPRRSFKQLQPGSKATVVTQTITLHVCVEDTGVGMTPRILANACDAYQRGPTKEGGGSGLGLYIVKEYIEAMGGDFYLKSSPNKGTRAGFQVPLMLVDGEQPLRTGRGPRYHSNVSIGLNHSSSTPVFGSSIDSKGPINPLFSSDVVITIDDDKEEQVPFGGIGAPAAAPLGATPAGDAAPPPPPQGSKRRRLRG